MIKYIYFTAFLTTTAYAFLAYINSSFLGKFIPNDYIGLIYGIGSLFTLVLLSNISRFLRKWGHYEVTISILSIQLASLLFLGMADFYSASWASALMAPVLVFFIVLSISYTLLTFSYDIYLEKYSKDTDTGKSRGTYLTIINLAILFAPYIVGKILSNGDYYKIYFLALAVLFLAFLTARKKMRAVPDVDYTDPPFFATLAKIWRNKNIWSIFVSSFLLQFFYSWMIIYNPLYLNGIMGFSWADLGIMFTIMLLPFVLIQLPLGKIADKYIGEKEILTSGFFIMGLSTIAIYFISSPNFFIFTFVLFLTRVGAAAVEIMNETYFFKKVSPCDSDIIGFFRNSVALAFVIGPISASLILAYLPFATLYLILGVFMLFGLKLALAIEDTL